MVSAPTITRSPSLFPLTIVYGAALPNIKLNKPLKIKQTSDGGRRRTISTVDLPSKEANVLKGHEGAVLTAVFNGEGNYFFTGGKDRTIRPWNPHRGIHIKIFKSHDSEVRDIHIT